MEVPSRTVSPKALRSWSDEELISPPPFSPCVPTGYPRPPWISSAWKTYVAAQKIGIPLARIPRPCGVTKAALGVRRTQGFYVNRRRPFGAGSPLAPRSPRLSRGHRILHGMQVSAVIAVKRPRPVRPSFAQVQLRICLAWQSMSTSSNTDGFVSDIHRGRPRAGWQFRRGSSSSSTVAVASYALEPQIENNL